MTDSDTDGRASGSHSGILASLKETSGQTSDICPDSQAWLTVGEMTYQKSVKQMEIPTCCPSSGEQQQAGLYLCGQMAKTKKKKKKENLLMSTGARYAAFLIECYFCIIYYCIFHSSLFFSTIVISSSIFFLPR